MLLIHGTYRLAPKRVAFRNDFCLTCGVPRRAFRVRTFDLFHIFWIPILPIGFWKRWRCGTCGADPHANVQTRRSYKIVGIVLLLFMALVFWLVPLEKDTEAVAWAFRIGAPLLAIWEIWNVVKTPVQPSLARRLAEIPATEDAACPVCGFPLANTPNWHCPRCGLRRA